MFEPFWYICRILCWRCGINPVSHQGELLVKSTSNASINKIHIQSMMGPDTDRFYVSRDNILILLCLVFVLPLSLFRSLESLRFTSLFSVACITFMTLTIIVKYFEFVSQGFAPTIPYQLSHLKLFNFELKRILRTVPLVIFAYTCHPNVLPIYLVLKRRSSTRMYKV
jgi:amino acid permease